MIIYATKQTIERYKLKLPDELEPPYDEMTQILLDHEQNDKLLEWGCKLFYCSGKKCLQFVNFASKLTIIAADVKISGVKQSGNYIYGYISELYKDDPQMVSALDNMFKRHPFSCFNKLTDRSIISTLNFTQRTFLADGDRLYDFIDENSKLHLEELHKKINTNWVFTRKVGNQTDYFYSGALFRKLVLEKYK